MKPVEDFGGRDAAPGASPVELDGPDFTSWAAGLDLTPPELSDFPAGEAESTPDEPQAFGWELPVEEPPFVGEPQPAAAPESAAADRRAEEPKPDAADAEAPEEPPRFDIDTLPGAESAGAAAPTVSPPAAMGEPPADDRRARLRELAARLWTAKPRTDAPGEPHLVCGLGDSEFALALGRVREVQRLPPVTPVPRLPGWLLGVTNWRGDVLSVVDLAAFLGLPPESPSRARRLVVVQAGDGLTTGLVVDRVRGLRVLAPDRIEPSALDLAPHVRGVCLDGGDATVVLDLDDLLLSPRMRRPDPDEADAAPAE